MATVSWQSRAESIQQGRCGRRAQRDPWMMSVDVDVKISPNVRSKSTQFHRQAMMKVVTSMNTFNEQSADL